MPCHAMSCHVMPVEGQYIPCRLPLWTITVSMRLQLKSERLFWVGFADFEPWRAWPFGSPYLPSNLPTWTVGKKCSLMNTRSDLVFEHQLLRQWIELSTSWIGHLMGWKESITRSSSPCCRWRSRPWDTYRRWKPESWRRRSQESTGGMAIWSRRNEMIKGEFSTASVTRLPKSFEIFEGSSWPQNGATNSIWCTRSLLLKKFHTCERPMNFEAEHWLLLTDMGKRAPCFVAVQDTYVRVCVCSAVCVSATMMRAGFQHENAKTERKTQREENTTTNRFQEMLRDEKAATCRRDDRPLMQWYLNMICTAIAVLCCGLMQRSKEM